MFQSKSLIQSSTFIMLSLTLTACPITLGGSPLPESLNNAVNTSSGSPSTPIGLKVRYISNSLVEVSWQPVPGAKEYSLSLDGKVAVNAISETNYILPIPNLNLGISIIIDNHIVGITSIAPDGQKSEEIKLNFSMRALASRPTLLPSMMSSEDPPPVPTTAPTPILPKITPSPAATAIFSPTPIPRPTPTPIPTPTPLIVNGAIIELTKFAGKIFDDAQSPLDGVTVKVKSLNSSVPYEATTVTAGGTYAFNNAPSGVQVEIVSSKAGFTARKRVEVLKANKQGDPNVNRYDFGTDGGAFTFSEVYNALSDKPEVVTVTPVRNGSGVEPKTSFVLKFSEPIDKKTAEDTFSIRSFNSRRLTVDSGNNATINTFIGSSLISSPTGTPIWDKGAFNIAWNSDDSEVTFSFKEEKLLPTDKDSNLVPDYNVAFRSFSSGDRALKDKSGISRNEKHFKLTDGDFEESYKFSIKTDEVKPFVTGITVETNENAGQNGDAVKVRFSERMIIYTRDIAIAGGMSNIVDSDQKAPAAYPGGTIATSTATAKNYQITVTQTGGGTAYAGTWAALGGTAMYDTTDLTYKTVLLLPVTVSNTANNVYFVKGVLSSVAGTFNTDALNNSPYNFNLIRSSAGNVGASVSINITLANILANNAAVAADLQAKLNLAANAVSPTPSNNPFTVTSTADNKINLVFNDTSGHYLGFNVTANPDPTGTEIIPLLANFGGTSLIANSKLDLYKPGDTVRVKVNSTVLDPAGNTLDSSRDNAFANAS
ncbi:MAG: carboxypeptidase regulatory-like domain-containing protein [Candidatus Sericytochromatia bacterium]|nr:carboxypeptidase regulatory-like domain-containing protein [Candidatus Sericytochromatia bacterium]